MPATSLKQKQFMDAAAHNASFAKQAGIPQTVAKDFSESSKGMKFGRGYNTREDLQGINKPKTDHGKMSLMKKGGESKSQKELNMKKMSNGGITERKMGSVKTAAPSKDGVASKGKTKGTMIKMGAAKPLGMKKGGMTKKMNMGGRAC
jgi:hypothetical protein